MGSTNCALFGKYCTDTVLAPAGMEAPVNEYTPQPEKKSASAIRRMDMLVRIFNFYSLKPHSKKNAICIIFLLYHFRTMFTY